MSIYVTYLEKLRVDKTQILFIDEIIKNIRTGKNKELVEQIRQENDKNKIYINSYGIEHTFQKGENIIEFTPTKSESIGYSCWMGMIKGNINVVE